MKRRGFLGSSLLTGGALLVPSFLKAETESTNLLKETSTEVSIKDRFFCSESGMLGKDDIYVLGVMVVYNNTKTLEKTLKIQRTFRNFFAELSYSSNNSHKIDYMKDCIDFFMKNNIRFAAKVVKKEDFRLAIRGNLSPNKKKKFKLSLYQSLLSELDTVKTGTLLGKSNFVVKSQSLFGPTRNYSDWFKKELKLNYKAVHNSESNLLQLTDVLTGCIRGDMSSDITNQNKLAMIKYLKTELSMSNLSVGQGKGNKFIVT